MADFTLTLDSLFGSEKIMGAVINRIEAENQDQIKWKDYLSFSSTDARDWKVAYGAETGITVGSVIDRNSNKPLRERKVISSGYLSVMTIGDRWQLNNDNLEKLAGKVGEFNKVIGDIAKNAVLNEIIEILVRDYKEAVLAPHKRMDLLLGQLRSNGQGVIDETTNPEGIKVKDLKLPVKRFKADATAKKNFINFFNEEVVGKGSFSNVAVMEMNKKTFSNIISLSEEFKDVYLNVLGGSKVGLSGGLMSEAMANELFAHFGLPLIKIIDDYVTLPGNKRINVFEDDRIALLPSTNLGYLRYYKPLEAKDRVPNKTYNLLEGDHLISSQRTDEGRFVEYIAEWMPEFYNPSTHGVIELIK